MSEDRRGYLGIPLTMGYVAIVDASDYEFLNQFNWCASESESTVYAVRKIRKDGKATNISMHRLLTGAIEGQIVDHRDGDGLNNTRSNIRITNYSGNARNARRRKMKGNGLPKGVYVNPSGKTWRARIYVDGKNQHLGCFFSPEDAHKAYKDAAFAYYGEFARIA